MVRPPIHNTSIAPAQPPVAPNGPSTPRTKMIGTSAKSSNRSIEKADLPTALVKPTRGSTTAVEDRASASPRPIAPAQLWPIRCNTSAMIAADTSSSAAPTPNTSRRMVHSRRKRQFEPDREEQQDDPKLGKRLDRFGVGDGDESEARDSPGLSTRDRRGPTASPMRMKPMTGLILKRANAGMTIPAAPKITSASLIPDVLNSPAPCIPAFKQRRWRLSLTLKPH
jgi:hypothetical protein